MDKCNIFLFFRSGEFCTLRVYKVEVPDNYEENPLIAHTYFDYSLTVKKLELYSELKPRILTSCSSFVHFENYIYVFGGKQDWLELDDMRPGLYIPDVYLLDISDAASNGTNAVWELCGKMTVGRLAPGVVVHNRKCYIFGGMMKNLPYAEVYDLESGQSEVLPDPHRRHVLSTKVLLAQNNGDPYLITNSRFSNYLMLYHIPTKYWQFYQYCQSDLLNDGSPILVERDNIIYSYFNYKLHAYNLCNEEYFVATIKGLNEGFMDRHLGTPSLIHLQANTFCLIYEDGELYYVGDDKSQNVVIHVAMFDVVFKEIKGICKMQAHVRSNMNYIMEGKIDFEGAVRSR